MQLHRPTTTAAQLCIGIDPLAPPSSPTEARTSRNHRPNRPPSAAGRGGGMLRCERDPQNVARRARARVPPPPPSSSCYQTHRQRGRPRVNESGDLSLENHPSTRPPSPLRLYRVSISFSFSLVGERVQRPSRIHTPNPPFVASWCNASLSTASSSSSSSFGLYYIRACVCVYWLDPVSFLPCLRVKAPLFRKI